MTDWQKEKMRETLENSWITRRAREQELESELITETILMTELENILSLFKNTSLKEKNSEILYNVLKNKEGLKNLNLNIPSYPVADSTKMEGDIANREVNTIKDLNIIEIQD